MTTVVERGGTMSTIAVAQLLYLLDQAFEGDRWHSLVGNIGSVPTDMWSWKPEGGDRSIRDIVEHVGSCKVMYENHSFGDATLTWNGPFVDDSVTLDGPATAIAWLRDTQHRLRQSIAALDDDDLSSPRRTNWGDLEETRWIIGVMISHDLYHAGEINHLRSLASGDDRWAFARET
jgi:hypothetical protein